METAANSPKPPRKRISTRNRLLFFLTAWLIVLMPFLFWWNTWFGRHLSDQEISQYLRDEKKPRHIQHALVQIGERMSQQTLTPGNAAEWYPELVRISTYPVEEVRNTDAWVMGQDTTYANFHPALLAMLNDSSLMVRGNAALSLVRFGDASGRPQILALLSPATITATAAGSIIETAKPGTTIRQNGLVAKLNSSGQTVELRSPIAGRVRTVTVASGANVSAGDQIAVVDPAPEQVWEALRALYLIGQVDDLPAIRPYEREVPEVPDYIRQQAVLTEKAIQDRTAKR
ncbi:MAG TPA: biotin/lipoyl-binding protein [Terriglobales bacterium]